MSKPKIILIVGTSGSGKTHLSHYLSAIYGVKFIVSYTTRPMRAGETDGVDHHFIDSNTFPDEKSMLAYTKFGDYEYFTLRYQIPIGRPCSYIVDEKGVLFMQERFGNEYEVILVYVHASEDTRKSRGVSQDRIDRDKDRVSLPIKDYLHIFNNDSSVGDFEEAIDQWYFKQRELGIL